MRLKYFLSLGICSLEGTCILVCLATDISHNLFPALSEIKVRYVSSCTSQLCFLWLRTQMENEGVNFIDPLKPQLELLSCDLPLLEGTQTYRHPNTRKLELMSAWPSLSCCHQFLYTYLRGVNILITCHVNFGKLLTPSPSPSQDYHEDQI